MKNIIEKIKKERIIKSLFDSLIVDEDLHEIEYCSDDRDIVLWISIINNTLFICPDEVETIIGTEYNREIHDNIVNYLNPYNKYHNMICYKAVGKFNYAHISFEDYERIIRKD